MGILQEDSKFRDLVQANSLKLIQKAMDDAEGLSAVAVVSLVVAAGRAVGMANHPVAAAIELFCSQYLRGGRI
jgi:hypothetical protein